MNKTEENIEIFLQQGAAASDAGDYAKAAEWFSKAAEQGDAAAQYKLGGLYEEGRGVPQDKTKAAEWFRKAAEQGNKEAMDFLAKLEAEEEKTKAKNKLKNTCLRLNGKIYAFLSGKPYPDNPKKFVYLVRKMDKEPDHFLSDFFLWNVEFVDEDGNMDVWPYEEDNSLALMEELEKDYVEHAFDDD